jgi:hypothetical protein
MRQRKGGEEKEVMDILAELTSRGRVLFVVGLLWQQ